MSARLTLESTGYAGSTQTVRGFIADSVMVLRENMGDVDQAQVARVALLLEAAIEKIDADRRIVR